MKRYLKMIGNILMYGGVYFIMNFAVSIFFMIGALIMNIDKLEDPNFLEFLQEKLLGQTQIILVISGILSILVYALIMRFKKKNLIKYCNFSSPGIVNAGALLVTAIAFTTISTVLIDITEFYKYFPDTLESLGELVIGDSFLKSLLVVGIFVPIIEEILFRGLIFNELKKNINVWAAVILQALIFGAFHMNLLQGVVTFFIGLIMGLVYMWVKSIWAPIIIHIVNNSISVIASYYLPQAFEFEMPYSILAILIGILVGALTLSFIRKRNVLVPEDVEIL